MISTRRRVVLAALLAIAVAAAAVVVTLLTRGSTGGIDPGPEPDRITRDGATLMLDGRPWRAAGVNEYWLGLDDNITDSTGPTYPTHAAIDSGLAAARALGARLVRATTLGVSVGGPRTLEPTLGRFDDAAFAPIDYAVAKAREDGLRLMIPLTDQGHYYHGGKHTFTNWTGHPDIPGETVSDPEQREREAAFYTDPRTIAAFHAYVTHLLDHVNAWTGQRLGAETTIAIWETGNEMWDAPPSWTEQTAAFIKKLAPAALVADGSDSTGVDIHDTAVGEPDVDIVDAHFYPVDAPTAVAQARYTAGVRKVYLIGEYPLNGPAAATRRWLATVSSDPDISGALAWTLLPRLADGRPEPHGEAYTFHYPGTDPDERRWDSMLRHSAVEFSHVPGR